MKFNLVLCIIFLSSCSAQPSKPSMGSGDKQEEGVITVGSKGDDNANPQGSEEISVEPGSEEEVDKDAALYTFDAAFPVAASLMGSKWSWVRDDNMPLGWGETNSFTAILDYMYLSNSQEYVYLIDKIYNANVNKGEKNFINEFYDDTGWWGLAWIRAYDITKDKKYLEAAKTITDYMNDTGWDDKTCGGGLLWKRGEGFKSAIGNALYIKLAASLHARISGDSHYFNMAKKGWAWFLKSGMVNDANIVVDGLESSSCKASGTAFTYNQGVILGAATELYQGSKDEQYLDFAKKIVKPGMKYFSNDQGILYEKHRNNDYDCSNGDNIYFRGAYVRNLRELNGVLNDQEIKAFISKTAQFAWDKSRAEYDSIASCWEKGTDNSYSSGRQTSALDLMNGTIVKKVDNIVLRKTVKASVDSCKSTEGPSNAFDGSSSTKWCAKNPSEGATVDIDLGASKVVHRIRIAHAGTATPLGDTKELNTQDFEILSRNTSTESWQTVAKIVGNKSSGTSSLVGKKAQFLRIHVTNAGSDGIIRIYEVIVE